MDEKTRTILPEEIKDPVAKMWYDNGVLFALNYVHAIFPRDQSFTRETFKDFINQTLSDENSGDLIHDKYFVDRPFSEDNSNYPDGLCPGVPPTTCIQCLTKRIVKFPKGG